MGDQIKELLLSHFWSPAAQIQLQIITEGLMGSKRRCHMLILPDKLQAAARVYGDGGLSHCVKMLIYEDTICLCSPFTGYFPFLTVETD